MQKKSEIKQKRVIFDRLYRALEYSDEDLRLYQTKEITRLRQVSLSAVPTWLLPAGMCASKFEHSVGVGHLAKIVGKNPVFKDIAKDLYFAALAHDLGTPPFSHTSEQFQQKLFGKNHEEYIDIVLEGSEFAREIKKQGGSPERIARFVKGEEKPWSDIVNGSIDIDNLDNSLRFGMSMGIIPEQMYNPEQLAKAYHMRKKELILQGIDLNSLQEWEQCRKDVYSFVYSTANICPAMMIWQAIYFALEEGEIHEDYFYMTDVQAFEYLENECNSRTQEIVKKAKSWQFFQQVFNYTTTTPSTIMQQLFADAMNQGVVAKELSKILHVEPTHIAVHFGKNKGFKKIHLPIVDTKQEQKAHIPQNELSWMVQVYVDPSVSKKSDAIREFIEDKLRISSRN